MPVRIEDDAAFKVAKAMHLGSVSGSGNLRLVVTQPDDTEVALELTHKLLHGDMGLAAFIRINCTTAHEKANRNTDALAEVGTKVDHAGAEAQQALEATTAITSRVDAMAKVPKGA